MFKNGEESNENQDWCVSVMPTVSDFISENNDLTVQELIQSRSTDAIKKSIESGMDSKIIRDRFTREICSSLKQEETRKTCNYIAGKYYKQVI